MEVDGDTSSSSNPSAHVNGSLKAASEITKESSNRPVKKAKTPSGGYNYAGDYRWQQLHDDLERDHYAGVYGGCNSVYFGLAGLRANVDMDKFHHKRSKDEFYIEELDQLLQKPETQKRWNDICTIDPLGMYSKRPTIAATTARMMIPELKLEVDGKIVNDDNSINVVKCAVDYAWNLPMLSNRLGMKEADVRAALYKYTQIEKVQDPNYNVFLPPTGGVTVYFFGDIAKLADKSTEVAVRVHDQCTGSDVFGTDICTCRPYLVFAIKGVVECAQRGGVGLVIYFQKEGRSLGEVTKFRVYNARKKQAGGDRPENYFYQTESIAGIRDARFQEMMPDFLLWLGIQRIDWLLSMSNDKYDAIVSAGIEVMQRVALPDQFVPAGAQVEITAKISAGYHTDKIDSGDIVADLRKLEKIRERCGQIFQLAQQGHTRHWKLHMEKLDESAAFVVDVMKKSYPTLNIPYHSRWRHFSEGSVESLTAQWHCSPNEVARRLIDLVTVSVLLDAGSGPVWKYVDTDGSTSSRSEGIAHATLDMFKDGKFSSDIAMPHRCNSFGLKNLVFNDFSHGFQVSTSNPMTGLEGRFKILRRLGRALEAHPEFFGHELPRPGNVIDYVLEHVNKDTHEVSIRVLWRAVIEGLEGIWPNTHTGIRRGDIWAYHALKQPGKVGSDLVPFHKLSQWLTLSLLEPIEHLGVKFTEMHLLTGLAEYRNGGLFVDTGVLSLLKEEAKDMMFDVGAELIVEWRALTICLLDVLAERVRRLLNMTPEQLPLTKILQGGTWAAGRVAAAQKRAGGTPPINIRSDGSVF